MIHRFLDFISSLKLTVVCLALAMVLVIVGTVAQVKLGLWVAQEHFFRSYFVYWQPEGASWKIPVLPGGWLLGSVLLVNLLAAHAKRFAFTKKKAGIILIHAGLILLLVGQFLTEVFQKESSMRLTEGEAKNYSETYQRSELVFVDTSDKDHDKVISVPQSLVAKKGEFALPELPLTVRVKDYWPNSFLTTNLTESGVINTRATEGIGKIYGVVPQDTTAKMDEINVPSAVVEINSSKGPLATLLVTSDISRMQSIQFDGKTYEVGLRFKRFYNPYYIQLQKFTHERYKGTDVPKNFASRIRVKNPQRAEDREVLIYMNNPLRYQGKTFFQGSFDPKDARVSIFQVVENPAWLTPYISCTLVGVGLLVQFLSHLIGFAKRRSDKGKDDEKRSQPQPAKKRKAAPEPAALAVPLTAAANRRDS